MEIHNVAHNTVFSNNDTEKLPDKLLCTGGKSPVNDLSVKKNEKLSGKFLKPGFDIGKKRCILPPGRTDGVSAFNGCPEDRIRQPGADRAISVNKKTEARLNSGTEKGS